MTAVMNQRMDAPSNVTDLNVSAVRVGDRVVVVTRDGRSHGTVVHISADNTVDPPRALLSVGLDDGSAVLNYPEQCELLSER